MSTEVTIIADSYNPHHDRITTMRCVFSRTVLAELERHRVFSFAAASSRAVPVTKLTQRVRRLPYVPVWYRHQAGMALSTLAPTETALAATSVWWRAMGECLIAAEQLSELGVQKEAANRLLEPYQQMELVLTATEWDGFFLSRVHPDASPVMRELAEAMLVAYQKSEPAPLGWGHWHVPYGPDDDDPPEAHEMRLWVAAGRVATISYLNLGQGRDWQKDVARAEMMRSQSPPHPSPFEHVAQAVAGPHANYQGWLSLRTQLDAGTPPPSDERLGPWSRSARDAYKRHIAIDQADRT